MPLIDCLSHTSGRQVWVEFTKLQSTAATSLRIQDRRTMRLSSALWWSCLDLWWICLSSSWSRQPLDLDWSWKIRRLRRGKATVIGILFRTKKPTTFFLENCALRDWGFQYHPSMDTTLHIEIERASTSGDVASLERLLCIAWAYPRCWDQSWFELIEPDAITEDLRCRSLAIEIELPAFAYSSADSQVCPWW